MRSSGHTLRYSKSRTQDTGPLVGIKQLPSSIRKKLLIPYNRKIYTIREEVARMLRSLNPSLIGNFETQNDRAEHNLRLEDFVVPALSLLPSKKSKARNGVGEKAQLTLSDFVANDQEFLDKFDLFLMEVILPWLKEKLISDGLFMEDSQISFYYQRPPTLRIQPGPSTRGVQAHSDATYGHQDGELNFWMPLTDPNLTLTDLWAESEPGKEDYQALGPKLGEVVSFHGSSCKHYVPPNLSSNTRVSIDFRVGIEGYFDPHWKMRGTKSDHTRRTVRL